MTDIAEQLRKAVRESDKSVYRIAADIGVAQTTLDSFVHGSDSRGALLSKLAAYFEMRLVRQP